MLPVPPPLLEWILRTGTFHYHKFDYIVALCTLKENLDSYIYFSASAPTAAVDVRHTDAGLNRRDTNAVIGDKDAVVIGVGAEEKQQSQPLPSAALRRVSVECFY
jgi:hypothetical protein